MHPYSMQLLVSLVLCLGISSMPNSIEDERLAELNRQRSLLDQGPNWRDDEGEPGFISRMTPLLISQALDLLTTEQVVNQPGGREMNPIPGLQGFPGRFGMQLLQTLLMDQIHKQNPKIGNAGINLSTHLHSGAALGNAKTAEDQKFYNLYRGQ